MSVLPRIEHRSVAESNGSGRPQKRGLDQLIEPLDPKHLKSESAAQEAFDKLLLAKLSEKRNQLDNIRKERKKELAKLRRKRPMPKKSVIFDPSTFTSMHDLKQVFTGSSRYIVQEVNRMVPQARYNSKKKWFLGIRLVPLTAADKAAYKEQERARQAAGIKPAYESSSDSGESSASNESSASGESSQEGSVHSSGEQSVNSDDNSVPAIDLPDAIGSAADGDIKANGKLRKTKKTPRSKKERSPSPPPTKRLRRPTRQARKVASLKLKQSSSSESIVDDSEVDEDFDRGDIDNGESLRSTVKPRSSVRKSSSKKKTEPPPPTVPQLLASISTPSNNECSLASPSLDLAEQPSEVTPPKPPPKSSVKSKKKSKLGRRYLMAEGPMTELAARGRLRKPNRRVGFAGKLHSNFGTSVVSPNMGSAPEVTNEESEHSNEDEEGCPSKTMPDLPQGARVRRNPQLPVEEKLPSTIEHLLSAGRGPKSASQEQGTTTARREQGDTESSETDEDAQDGGGCPKVAEERLHARKTLEEKHNSRQFSSVETSSLRTAVPDADSNKKPKRKSQTKKVLDPVKSLDPPSVPQCELVYDAGAVTTLAKIRANFYPGRNTQMISKSMQLRIPGCNYIRGQQHFMNVRIVHLNSDATQEGSTES